MKRRASGHYADTNKTSGEVKRVPPPKPCACPTRQTELGPLVSHDPDCVKVGLFNRIGDEYAREGDPASEASKYQGAA